MIEFAGMQLGTVFQGGTLVAMLALLSIVGRAWIVGIPERLRVANEAKINAAAELANRYEAWRKEVHALKNEMMVMGGKIADCDKALLDSRGINRHLEAQKNTTLFIIRLLMRELERKDAGNLIVQQARDTLDTLGEKPFSDDQSTTLATAEHTVDAAKAVVEEVKQAEKEGGK